MSNKQHDEDDGAAELKKGTTTTTIPSSTPHESMARHALSVCEGNYDSAARLYWDSYIICDDSTTIRNEKNGSSRRLCKEAKGKERSHSEFEISQDAKLHRGASHYRKSKRNVKTIVRKLAATFTGVSTKPKVDPILHDKKAHLSLLTGLRQHFQDPVTFDVMADPVICDDGHTYDRQVIERHFRTRIESERVRQEPPSEEDDNNSTCCSARNRPIELTSPLTGEIVSANLIPNRLVEQQIVEALEDDQNACTLLDISQEDLSDWYCRRDEKRVAEQRRAEESRKERERQEEMNRNRRKAEERRAQEEKEKTRNQGSTSHSMKEESSVYRIDRQIAYGKGLSENDIGLSVALCHDVSQRVPGSYVEKGSPRCMVGCCRAKLLGSFQWCSRCGRIVCRTCIAFEVTEHDAQQREKSEQGEQLHRICGECVTQIVQVMDWFGSTGQARAYIICVRLEPYIRMLTCQAKAAQEANAQNFAAKKFGPEVDGLREEIEILREYWKRLRRKIEEASERRRIALDGGGKRRANDFEGLPSDIEELEEIHAQLEEQYTSILNNFKDKNTGEDEFFEMLSIIGTKLNEAQRRIIAATGFENKDMESKRSTAKSNHEDIDSLERKLEALTHELFGLVTFEMPNDDDGGAQVAHEQAVQALKSRMETAQNELAEARSIVLKEKAYKWADDARSNEDEFVQHDDKLLQFIGKWDEQWRLPLGLSYPTRRMEQQLELLENALRKHLPVVEREYENEYDDQRAALVAELSRIENNMKGLRRHADLAEAEALKEEERLKQRQEERIRHQEKERLERERRERMRLKQERKAKKEEESLRQEHAKNEDATRRAFAAALRNRNTATAFGEQGDLKMCRICKAGPVVNKACANLEAHKRANHCRHCGNFDSNWQKWLPWDGISGPH